MTRSVDPYEASLGKARLRRLLKEGARRNADRDLEVAREWDTLDEALPCEEGT